MASFLNTAEAVKIELAPTASSVPETIFKSKAVFDQIRTRLEKEGKSFVEKIKGIYCFKITLDGIEGVWIVDLKHGSGNVKYDIAGACDVTITVGDEYFLQMSIGKLSPPEAFMKGYLKVQGNLGLAFKLRDLLQQLHQSKL